MPKQRGNLELAPAGSDTGIITAPGGVVTNAITEYTAANGVDVDGCLIKDGRAEALATAAMFSSTEQTATGSAQTIAHGFGAIPTMAWFTFSELPADLAAGADIAVGTHTTANLEVTVTPAGAKFYAYAIK